MRIPNIAQKLLLTAAMAALTLSVAAQTRANYSVGPISVISQGCGGSNAEVEQATDAVNGNYVYEAWIGCGGIGFVRSIDGGKTFSPPQTIPGSSGAWDPTIAVAPDGTVYVGFNTENSIQFFPMVVASFDHGQTFPQSTSLLPPKDNNWGDRVFLATGPDGTVYATWDYGPDISKIQLICSPIGSCSYSAGDLNIVMQKSTDGGKTFGPMTHVSPNFPAGGGLAAPMVVEPDGQIDTYYMADSVVDPKTFKLGPGDPRYTASVDGGEEWSTPQNIAAKSGKTSIAGWWIDGAIASDEGGNLYATWDTQGKNKDGTANDIGWISYSTDHGQSWSNPIQTTPDTLNVPHILAVAGGSNGIVYVGWLSPSDSRGYALYVRAYSIKRGWLSSAVRISNQFGNSSIWPGDTFGISTLGTNSLVLSWGSAVGGAQTSSIFAVAVQIGVD
jgi:hypothetical protein